MLKRSVCLLEKGRSRENRGAEDVNGTALTERKRGLVKKLNM